jgi:enoyl-CoA hydratase
MVEKLISDSRFGRESRKATEVVKANRLEYEHLVTDREEISKIIRFEKDPEKKIAWITFDNPKKNNCIPVAGFQYIGELLTEVNEDEDVKVVIFRGNGPCFGSGADADELGYYVGYKADPKYRPPQRQRVLGDYNNVAGATGHEFAVAKCMKATISQIHSYCYGEHLGLVLMSDLAVATEDALFVHPGWRYLGPMTNIPWYYENLGPKLTNGFMLCTGPLTAEEALRGGMLNKVVKTKEELEQTVMEYATAIAIQPMDCIVMGKAWIQMAQQIRGIGPGMDMGWMSHGWITNFRLVKGEWNFVRERAAKGVTNTFADRDMMVAPWLRLSKERRAMK